MWNKGIPRFTRKLRSEGASQRVKSYKSGIIFPSLLSFLHSSHTQSSTHASLSLSRSVTKQFGLNRALFIEFGLNQLIALTWSRIFRIRIWRGVPVDDCFTFTVLRKHLILSISVAIRKQRRSRTLYSMACSDMKNRCPYINDVMWGKRVLSQLPHFKISLIGKFLIITNAHFSMQPYWPFHIQSEVDNTKRMSNWTEEYFLDCDSA
jgi:hypothetical protein